MGFLIGSDPDHSAEAAETYARRLLDGLPGRVGIELSHRGAERGGVRSEVLLVDDAVLAANESLNAAVAIGGGPGDHRVASDHVAVD